MSLHRLLFDPSAPAESANLGAFLRMDENGKLVSYSNFSLAGNVSFSFVDADVTVGSDSIAEVAHGLETGDIVQLTSSGTLPAGLALATDYYVIRVSADAFKLATSLADAEAGVAVDITAAAGGGTHTVTEQERVHAAMDVYVVNSVNATIDGTVSIDDNGGSITVDAVDLDIRDLDHAQDSVAIGDGTDLLAINADGSINITDNGGSITIDGTVSISGDVNVTQGTSPWVVSATDLDIRDLDAAQDSVAAWLSDGAGNALSSTGGALDVNIANAGEIAIDLTHNTAILADAETVTTSSGALVTSPLANRENIFMYNNGNKIVYIGESGVTTGSGFPLFPGSLLEAKIGPAVAIHAVAESGSQDVRILQLS